MEAEKWKDKWINIKHALNIKSAIINVEIKKNINNIQEVVDNIRRM